MTIPLAQQMSGLDLAIRILSGSAAKPSKKEAAFIVERLRAADATLFWVQSHEPAIKAAIAARRETERGEAA